MKWFRKLLFPFTPLYYLGALLNKKLYDWNIKKSVSYTIPVICVGNLSVGGTGKSPMVAYLITLLKSRGVVATLSRGYKRKSKGFQQVFESSTALEVGDEPLQFKLNFPEAIIAVDADRKNGIQTLLNLKKPPRFILLDDAFQHRKIKAGLQILLTAYTNVYVNDWMLPSGDLREPISGAKRASIIVVTKCPSNISKKERVQIESTLKLEPYQQLFFSYIDYGASVKNILEEVALTDFLKKEFTLVTGIANPKPLVAFLKSKSIDFEHLEFPDHHNFSDKEIELLSKQKTILTTEKDYMRLRNFLELKDILNYLPIKVSFIEGGERFNNVVFEYMDSFES